MPLPPSPRPPRISRSGTILLLYSALGLAAVGWGALRGHPNVFVYPGEAPRHTLLGIALGAAMALLAVLLWKLASHSFEWARTLNREFRAILGPLTGADIFLLAATSSVGEELFFRGAMVPHLGLVLSSAIFGLLHIGPGARFLPWTALSVVVGVLLGLLFVYTGDLSGSICAHFLINFVNLHRIRAWRS